MQETRKQVKKETKVLEKAKAAVIREITMGACKIRAMGKRINNIASPAKDGRCLRCISENIPPTMKNVQEEESLEETYKNIMNLKEEYTDKMERLLREATGAASEDEEFNSRCF